MRVCEDCPVEIPAAELDRYAELVVRTGANVGAGQLVFVGCLLGHAPFARAVARAAYRAGARYVDVRYADRHIERALIESGPEESLGWSPPWLMERMRATDGQATIGIAGDPEPDLLGDLDPHRVGRSRMKQLSEESLRLLNAQATNWTLAAFPSEGWASMVFGEPDVGRLWEAVAFAVRLDENDPVAAWQRHVDGLERRAAALNALDLDAVRFAGDGTDLTVGLLPASRFRAARFTAGGRSHIPNMPTEEVFTTPDARRPEGTVRSTRPLALRGQIVRGLELRFEGGRCVDVRAETGADVVREELASDEGAAYLGELALVDGSSRVGQTGLTFFDTLFDENATCHIAYGAGLSLGVEGDPPPEGLNTSSVHTDFMVGGPEIAVDGLTRDGRTVPLLREDLWQLPD